VLDRRSTNKLKTVTRIKRHAVPAGEVCGTTGPPCIGNELVGVAEMLVDVLDQHLSPIKATWWVSLGMSDYRLWHFARPPHRLALGAHQRHPYDAAERLG